ncbi:MAG: hypothetical protein JWL92_136 [Candidatus Nomurabacteria bacterium]|nr:hypothetical protein [Candidatus Nomurabacteria bacterium]
MIKTRRPKNFSPRQADGSHAALRPITFMKSHKSFFYSIAFLLLFSFSVSFASPPGSPYAANATLDPSCGPTDTNCYVSSVGASAWSGITGTPTTIGGYGITDAYTKTASDARYEVPLTFSTGLTRTTNTLTVNASQNISTLSNLTSNGIVTTSGGTGALGITSTNGSGNVVLTTSPVLVSPTLGAAAATSINGLVITTSTGTLTVANGKTLTASNTLTLGGTDGSTLNIGTGGTLGTAAYTSAAAYEVPLTFSTGLTRSVNTITNNLLVGVSGGQTIKGGTAVTDILKLQGTTGNGTLTSPAVQIIVGNNGATTALNILNNGQVGIGGTPTNPLSVTGNANITGSLALGTALAITSGGTGDVTASGARTQLGVAYATNSDVISNTHIATWGDSLTWGQGGASYPSQLGNLTGYSIYNGGISGNTSTQIAASMTAATDKYSYTTIIWAGRNDITITGPSAVATIESNIATMVAALGHTRYIIIGVTNTSAETTGNANLTAISTLNSDLATAYGARFIDIRTYLLTQGTGIGQDATDVSNGVIPVSLRSDGTHLNTSGYALVAAKINTILPTIQATPSILTTANAQGILGSRSSWDVANGGKYTVGGVTTTFLPDQTNYTGTIFLGDGGTSLSHSTGSEGQSDTFVGLSSGSALTTGNSNSALGRFSLNALTTGSNNSAFGFGALQTNITNSGNTAIGSLSLAVNIADNNTSLGYQSGKVNTTGANNTFIGTFSGFSNISGASLVAVGFGSLQNSTSSFNTAIGYQSATNSTTGQQNTVGGYSALNFNKTGSNNTVWGTTALFGSSNASNYSNNTAVGYRAGWVALTGADSNTLIGYQTGYTLTTGAKNIMLGAFATTANSNITTGSNNIMIGNDIQAPGGTSSNQLNIGNLIFGTGVSGTGSTIAGSVGIGVNNPAYTLQVGNASVAGIVSRFQNSTGTCDINPTTTALACSSDMNLKKNVTLLADNSSWLFNSAQSDANASILDKVLALKPVTYNWNAEGNTDAKHAGFIAQDVRNVFPDLIAEDANTHLLSLNYLGLMPYTIQAIKEMDVKIAAIPTFADATVTTRLSNFLKDVAENGLGIFNRVQTKELCVDDVCVTRDQFKHMIEQSGQTPAPSAPVVPATPPEEVQTPEVTPPVVVEDPAPEAPAETQ